MLDKLFSQLATIHMKIIRSMMKRREKDEGHYALRPYVQEDMRYKRRSLRYCEQDHTYLTKSPEYLRK